MVMDLATRTTRDLTAGSFDGQPFISPAFAGANQILAGSRVELIAINLADGTLRDVVPNAGRVPRPQDPAPSPDGIRYAFSDVCGGTGLNLFIARIDGTTGDTCANAVGVVPSVNLLSADWGPAGFIAAEIQGNAHGVIVIGESTFGQIETLPSARNPAWPPSATKPPTCQ